MEIRKMYRNVLIFSFLLNNTLSYRSADVWSWTCLKENGMESCIREKSQENQIVVPLPTCLLTCGEAATLFPKPRAVVLERGVIYFLPSNIHHSLWSCHGKVCSMINEAFTYMIETIHKYHPKYNEKSTSQLFDRKKGHPHIDHSLMIHISVSETDEYFTLHMNESYVLDIATKGKKTSVSIKSSTFFGARHALETLSQLMDYDKERNALQMVKAGSIQDYPEYPYRGLLLDTSRNFYPVNVLKKVIDGMSYNKLNYFHWHITDTHSFPLLLKNLPQMSLYGAYSSEEVYTRDDVIEIVQYARLRGVKVIPELDAPAHVGHGWEWGEEEDLDELVVCLDEKPWNSLCLQPPCGQLNIANENIYLILGQIYEELLEIFSPVEMFHFGGDEVSLKCWNSSIKIREWMTNIGFGLSDDSFFRQWGNFQDRAREILFNANKGKEIPGIIWTSKLTDKERIQNYIDKNNYIIQIWTDSTNSVIRDILEMGYKVIFSNHDKLYLDCGAASYVSKGSNWCSPYKGWQEVYDNDIRFIAFNLTQSKDYDRQILGAEVAVWSEQIDEHTLDAKLWPRGAAHAERLWTNPSTNYTFAETRILNHRRRLIQRGLAADRLEPEWCRQNGNQCPKPWKPEEKKEIPLLFSEFSFDPITTLHPDVFLGAPSSEVANRNILILLLFSASALLVAMVSRYYGKKPIQMYSNNLAIILSFACKGIANNRLKIFGMVMVIFLIALVYSNLS